MHVIVVESFSVLHARFRKLENGSRLSNVCFLVFKEILPVLWNTPLASRRARPRKYRKLISGTHSPRPFVAIVVRCCLPVCERWAQSIWFLLHATLSCFVCVCIKSLVFQCGIRVSASSSSVIVFDIRLKFCWKASFGAFDTCETLSCSSSWSLALSCVFFHNRFQHFGHKECIRVCVTQQYCALYGFRTNGIWLTTLAAANNNRPAISHHAIATVCVF